MITIDEKKLEELRLIVSVGENPRRVFTFSLGGELIMPGLSASTVVMRENGEFVYRKIKSFADLLEFLKSDKKDADPINCCDCVYKNGCFCAMRNCTIDCDCCYSGLKKVDSDCSRYCVEILYFDDPLKRILFFGGDKENMLEFIVRKLRETKIKILTVKKISEND